MKDKGDGRMLLPLDGNEELKSQDHRGGSRLPCLLVL